MENFHLHWIATLQLGFFSSGARVNSQIRIFVPNPPRLIATLTPIFSYSSCLAGKSVVITSFNPTLNFLFLTNVISSLLTVSWGCFFLKKRVVGRENDVVSKRFESCRWQLRDSFALILQTLELIRENSFDLHQIPYCDRIATRNWLAIFAPAAIW